MSDKASWQNVNVETLPTAIREAYDDYKAAYAEMKRERDAFEAALRSALASATPKGKRIAIAYNFGKLSIAVVDDTSKTPSTAKALNLADLIKR